MDEERVFLRAEENLKFFDEHFTEFERSYPNNFVAISGANLVATGETPDAVFEKIDEKNIDRSDVLIEFIPIAGSTLIL